MTRFSGRLLALALWTALALVPAIATAADGTAMSKSMQSLVEQAGKDGMAVVVISPREKQQAAAQSDMSAKMEEMGLGARANLKRILTGSRHLFPDIAAAVTAASPDGTINWLLIAVATAIGGILVGFLPARLIQHWGRAHFSYLYNPHPRDDAEKIGYLLYRAMMIFVNTLLLFAVAAVVAIAFDTGHVPSRRTIFVIVSAYALWRILRNVVFYGLIAPDTPSHRMLNIADTDARWAFRNLSWVFGIATVTFAFSVWLKRINLAHDPQVFVFLVATLVTAMLIGALIVAHRKVFGGMILGAGDPEAKPVWRRFLAGNWHVPALVYIVIAWAVTSMRIVLGLPAEPLLIVAPPIAFVGGLVAYGVLFLAIERLYLARRAAYDRRIRAALKAEREQQRIEEAARREAEQAGLPEGEEEEENFAGEPEPHRGLPEYRPLFKPLMLQTAGIAVTLAAVAFVLGAWNVRVGERGNPVSAFMDTLVAIVVAWVLYRVVSIYVAAKLADEAEVSGANHEMEDEPAGHGTSRLATLLPIIRLAATTTIVVIAGMIVLSNLGVDIAPLFAGAGVVGLAVGFGAQTLIRDIFSGGFFLFDDAFRKGEYIELGDIRGTVEKISLRSFQLRHHNGPLHTIPFGEIKQLTNYSRDWVIMKLPLRLPFDTDIERVRKLVKKLGQDLLEHPDVGKNFLQPLKSQGVVQVEESAMILRVKFMTKPGDQWVTRKVVYASIQELFQREGIHLANREVTVRIADRPDRPLTDHEKQAAAAAASRLLSDQSKAGPGHAADDR